MLAAAQDAVISFTQTLPASCKTCGIEHADVLAGGTLLHCRFGGLSHMPMPDAHFGHNNMLCMDVLATFMFIDSV